jgi:SAM-dependent methyltransferase
MANKTKGWKRRGFKIQPGWRPWNKKWFRGIKRKKKQFLGGWEVFPSQVGVNARTISYIKQRFGFDIIEELVAPTVKRKKSPVKVMDVGGGVGFISAGLAAHFGKKVDVTLLGLTPEMSPKKVRQMVERDIKLSGDWNRQEGERLEHAKNALSEFEANIGKVKRRKALFENYVPGERYDLIIDTYGGSYYAKPPERAVQQTFNLLKPGGKALNIPGIFYGSEVKDFFDPRGKVAQTTGCYLKKVELLPRVSIVQKVRVNN